MTPDQVLIVEDAVSGVIAGTAAKVKVVGLLGTTSKEELLAAGATKIINNLQELSYLYE